MKTTVRSIWTVFHIFIEKVFDQTYRILVGVPTLKRSQITANLFLGGQYNLRGLRRLKEMGITAVVNMRMSSVLREAHYQGLDYLHLPTPDQTPPRLEDLEKGSAFIEEKILKGGKVYIHCRQGQGRGPSMVIAYLLRIGMTFDDALAMVKTVRKFIKPTPEQIARLREFEQQRMAVKN
jgi:dual specificity MAP kinase phosphatase